MSNTENASNNPPEPSNEPVVLSTRTVKAQVRKHPRAIYYTGTPSREHMLAKMTVYSQPDLLKFDRARVHGFLKSLKTGDIVGVEHYQYRVERISLKSLSVSVTNASKEEKELNKDHLNTQLALGYAEILYRDDKPYGIETEKEVTVKVVGKAPSKPEAPAV